MKYSALAVACCFRMVGALLGCLVAHAQAAEPPFDLVIRGGRIVDGSGAPWYVADIGIREGKIAKIGRITAADGGTVIDAAGLVVAPGFIDMMGQTASPMVADPQAAMNLLTQGITTINAGEGVSAAPLDKEAGTRQGWTTMAEYFALLESNGLPVNVVQTVGHTQVRRIVLGDAERRPSADELQKMQALVRESMEAGAIGVSTALIYPPAVYATTEEIAALAKIAGEKEGIEKAGSEFDIRQREITIRHLLEHRGGWDRDKSFDAMFESVRFARRLDVPAPAGPHDVIRAMLRQKLDFNPGERYAYSNFGYCLLGRVIEKLTGMPYEAYVKERVFAPIGIRSMRIGATRLEGRAAGEVRYYQPGTGKSVFQSDVGQEVPWPYGGWHLEAMDSHGGWIASAVDLARFAAAFDDPDHCPILSRTSIDLMHTRPPGLAGHDEAGQEKETFYSLGWFNRGVADGKLNHWHTGSLSGTATILTRRHDGRNFICLLNTRVSPASTHLSRDIDSLLHIAADAVKDWPTENRFAEFDH